MRFHVKIYENIYILLIGWYKENTPLFFLRALTRIIGTILCSIIAAIHLITYFKFYISV
jgi:hypothetical protein